MLRGAIDYTSPDRIGGWIFSEIAPVRGHTVLAFLDGQCVGAGRVELFRQDLADAGLADGHLGFNFDISINQPQDVERVVVKLERSDLVLVQPSARINGSALPPQSQLSLLNAATTIEWMRVRGWLEQWEFDFLKLLGQFGVYDLSLRKPKALAKAGGDLLLDPFLMSQRMLGLIYMNDIAVFECAVSNSAELHAIGDFGSSPERIVAIWSPTTESIFVVEGSSDHTSDPSSVRLEGSVEYKCGPDRLLFLNLHSSFKFSDDHKNQSFRVFALKSD